MADGSDDGTDDPVEVGVELLAKLERDLPVAEAVDRIETVTTNPRLTRRILDEAAARGLVERAGGRLRPTTPAFVRFESEVVAREGEFTCDRCGADISTGHFLRLDAGELGPFGSSCVRKVTGRD